MVAPLIVGAARVLGTARVVGGSSKAQLRAEAASARPELLRRVRARERRKEREETPLGEEEKQQQIANSTEMRQGARLVNRLANKLSGVPTGASANLKRIRAVSAATMIFWSAIVFATVQVTFWLVGMGFLGTKLTPLIGDWIPGEVVFIFCWFLIMTIGICTMVYATIMFTIRGVDCFGGMKGIIFIFCIAGYCTFFINFFPWFVVWIFTVSLLQKEGE